MKQKIGILTFHYAHNYGAMLQAYALKTKLNRMGYEAQVLNYQNRYIARLYKKGIHIDFWKRDVLPNRWGHILRLVKEQQYGKKEWQKQCSSFESFLKGTLMAGSETKVLTPEDLERTDCDTYVLGSDQIWARELTHGLDPVYFGQFAPKKRKISYAASVPNGDIPDAEKPLFKEYLSKLEHISVREERLAEELRMLLDKEVSTVVDPTLLLEKEDYTGLLYEKPLEAKAYVFAYYVVESAGLTKAARAAAKKMNCKLIELHYMKTPEREQELKETRESLDADYVYSAGPKEFLTYIRDAKLVLTNSFHGTVFSILFQKKFYSIYEINGRIENLLGFLGITNRHITEEDRIHPEEEINYADTTKCLAEYRRVSVEYLEKALG